jgi:hypothetical protein
MWCNQEFRDRMIEVYKTEEYQKFRSDLGKRNAEKTHSKTGTGNKPKMVSYKPKKKTNESVLIKQIIKSLK